MIAQQPEMSSSQPIETEQMVESGQHHFRLTLHGSLLELMFTEAMVWDYRVAEEGVRLRQQITQGKPVYLLVDGRNVRHVTLHARSYLAREGADGILAKAIVAGNPVLRMIGNFFLRLNKPPVPSSIFKTREEAVEWLSAQGCSDSCRGEMVD